MRALVFAIPLVTAAAGCIPSENPSEEGFEVEGRRCSTDADCGSDACDSLQRCMPPGSYRAVHVTWKFGQQAPDVASCADQTDIDLVLSTYSGASVSFGPLACVEGKFTISRLPNVLMHAQLEDVATGARTDTYPFTATGDVGFSLDW